MDPDDKLAFKIAVSNLILDLFFLVTLVQGAIRKWAAPSLSFEIQFFRDMLPVLAFIMCQRKPHLRRKLGRFTGFPAMLFWAYAGVAVFEACSPSLPVFVVVVGIRTHFAYLPLALLMPIYLKSWAHGLRKFRQLLVLAVPIFLLAFFQTTQPVWSVWNRYADPTMDVATFGDTATDTVRATGTFSYLAEFADFAGTCAIITVFLMLTTKNRIIGQLLYAGILVMALGAMMASGSRGPAVVFAARILGLAALGYRVGAIPMKHLSSLIAFTLLALTVSVAVLNQQATDFLSRAQSASGDMGWRVDSTFSEWLDVMAEYPMGVGLGAGHQAVVVQMLATGIPNMWEVELSRLAFELGIGVLVYLAFKIALIGQLLARVKAMRSRVGRTTLTTCTIILIPLLVTGSVYQPLSNAAFWAFVGVGFWIIKLEAATFPVWPAAASVLTRTAPVDRRRGGPVGEGAR
jgi:hypothetical protein